MRDFDKELKAQKKLLVEKLQQETEIQKTMLLKKFKIGLSRKNIQQSKQVETLKNQVKFLTKEK